MFVCCLGEGVGVTRLVVPPLSCFVLVFGKVCESYLTDVAAGRQDSTRIARVETYGPVVAIYQQTGMGIEHT